MFTAFLWPHFVCRFIWLGTAWSSLQSGPTESPGPGPLFKVPRGQPPCPAYLPHFVWAAKAAICEAVGKQMLFFHLWNQVSGKISEFWWPELSHRVQRGKGGLKELHSLWTLTCHHPLIAVKILCSSSKVMTQHCVMRSHLCRAIHAQTPQRNRHIRSLDADLSAAEQFLCQSSADADRQYGVEDACQKLKSENEMTDSHNRTLSAAASVPPCPSTSWPTASWEVMTRVTHVSQALTDGMERTAAYKAPHAPNWLYQSPTCGRWVRVAA